MIQEFVQEINNSIKKEIRSMHTAMPGTIVSFDPGKMTATVLPGMMFKKPDGKTIAYPQITGVPVVFPQGANQQCTVAFPVKAGDGCLIVIAEQSLDYWMYGQETSTDLAFDMTNAMCIPGLFSSSNDAVRAACAANAVVVDAKGTRITVKNGSVEIDAAEVKIKGNLTVEGEVKSAGDVNGSGISLATHTHTGDSGGTTSAPG